MHDSRVVHPHMNIRMQFVTGLLTCLGLTATVGYMQQSAAEKSGSGVLEMTSIPDGFYRANLRIDGQDRIANFEIRNHAVKCVNADYPKLKSLRGKFQLVGNGVFFVVLQNEQYQAGQHWVFHQDGSATLKEVPDRGEVQRAVRVKDDSLDLPKKD